MALFTNMALKATVGEVPYKKLCAVDDDKGSLEYAADRVIQPGTKFTVENFAGDLVHIRSCSNNKYWVRDAKNLIVAKAVEPVDDQTSPDCTLFRLRMEDNNRRATFYHVQSDLSGIIPTNILSIETLYRTSANLVNAKGLGGGMIWVIEYDDFNGKWGPNTPLMLKSEKK